MASEGRKKGDQGTKRDKAAKQQAERKGAERKKDLPPKDEKAADVKAGGMYRFSDARLKRSIRPI